MLRYAVEIEILETIPRVRLLRVPKPDFELLEAARYNPEWYAMIFFALRTGLRYGELCELRWYDVDLNNGRVNVRRSCYLGYVTTPKGGREREIPLSSQTIKLLREHRHLKGELVFCKEDGSRRRYDGSMNALKTLCRRANMRPLSWHVLRHTFASHLVMRGAPLKTVQELLGHATIEMTMRYAHLSPEVKRDAVDLLDASGADTDANEGHHRGTTVEISEN
jgi:integrase